MHCDMVSKLSVLLFKGDISGVSYRSLVVLYPHSCRYHFRILFRNRMAWSPIPLIGARASWLTNPFYRKPE